MPYGVTLDYNIEDVLLLPGAAAESGFGGKGPQLQVQTQYKRKRKMRRGKSRVQFFLLP